MKLRTYALATLIGIIPGTLAYTWLGRGLGDVIALAAASGREFTVPISPPGISRWRSSPLHRLLHCLWHSG